MQRTLEEHFAEVSATDSLSSATTCRARSWKSACAAVGDEFARRFAEHPDRLRATIANLMAHPTLAHLLKPHLLNTHMLDFAERVMGPFVQLDSFEITGFPSRPAEQFNRVAEWHRDAFNYSDMWANHPSSAHFKPHPYTAPTACNCLTYLQDMTAESGALRVVPGSHLELQPHSSTGARPAAPARSARGAIRRRYGLHPQRAAPRWIY